jgi:hypothetical protein
LLSAAAGHFALPPRPARADTGTNRAEDASPAKSAIARFFLLYYALLQLPRQKQS